MVERKWGRVIFISSESGVQIPAEMIHYGMTKTAQLAVSRGLAETVAGTGVTVNAVLPAPTRVRRRGKICGAGWQTVGKSFEQMEKDFFRTMRPSSLLKRFATNEEVANMVVYYRPSRHLPPPARPCAWMAACQSDHIDGQGDYLTGSHPAL